ncbi:hypothetical protein PtA15_7A16 [Puccinia triticina]|uniref:non-specific serine/threonine protein kinase n=1 Tax=Puccinia triticina TaxID=208348 RepID=A0ABY7CMI4_9BASI|nr:uncharacterized protein PtA15_7A16 [Puccinia triticina]WAQ86290.1 hypothetical protein PtA15_7A16 [Puccinia triticina]WAR56168.1 hypothetical protein PtB15_7B13 [Puccinia triticina]
MIGTTIVSPSPNRNRYYLNRILGQGSFSKVIQAHLLNQTNNQPVPSDQMPSNETDNIRMSTLREIEILKSIDHPTIIKLIESFTITNESTNLIKKNSSLQIIVLEELRGGELFELVSKFKSTLRPLIICRLMAELCISIHWLHQHDIVHRDLKLENILLVREIKNIPEEEEDILTNPNVYLKVTDFGLSVKLTKSVDPKHSTESGMKFLQSRCGSEEYAAPEIILGREYDGTKTDGWALGVIGYSLVMGFLPFKLPQRIEPGTEGDSRRASLTNSNEIVEEESEQAYLKKRKQGLLKIIKSEYRWKSTQSNHHLNHLNQNPMGSDDHQLVQGQIQLVDRLLVRDPLKRSSDLLFGFRDPTWLGRFNWLKDSLLTPVSSS